MTALIHWLGLLLATIMLALSPAAHAQQAATELDNLILERAYWEDPGGQADLAYAQSQTYTRYEGMLSRGYRASAHWIRLTLAPSDEPLALIVQPAWLDHITLHDPAGSAPPVTMGDRHPERRSALPGLGFSYELPRNPARREIWLRLQSTSSHVLMAQVLPMEQAVYDNARRILWATLYCAALLLIFLLLAFIWLTQPERVLGLYLIRHGCFALYAAAYLGVPRLLLSDPLPPPWLDPVFSFLVIAVLPASIPFEIAFLRIYQPRPFLLRLLQLLAAIGVAVLLALLAGQVQWALQANMWLMATLLLLLMLTALSTRPVPEAEILMPRKVMLAYYVALVVTLLLGVLSLLGGFQPRGWELYGWIMHILVTGVMMSIILMVRSQHLARQSRQAQWALQKSQLEVANEQQRREEQSQFLHMLMHELKTPLSIVSLALGTRGNRPENLAHASRAVQDMKAIIDRCVQADQSDQLSLRQPPREIDLPALIARIGQEMPQLGPRLHIDTPPHLPVPQTDPQFLQIVLENLLYNAQRYSDPLTPIAVKLASAEKQGQAGLSVRVANTPGLAGWPDEHKLFDKYYRSPGAQTQTGSGLGLYLSRQLAQSMGGMLDYAPSAQQVGFVLWLPLTTPLSLA